MCVKTSGLSFSYANFTGKFNFFVFIPEVFLLSMVPKVETNFFRVDCPFKCNQLPSWETHQVPGQESNSREMINLRGNATPQTNTPLAGKLTVELYFLKRKTPQNAIPQLTLYSWGIFWLKFIFEDMKLLWISNLGVICYNISEFETITLVVLSGFNWINYEMYCWYVVPRGLDFILLSNKLYDCVCFVFMY